MQKITCGSLLLIASAVASAGPTGYMFGFTPAGVQQLILNGTTTINASATGWWNVQGLQEANNTNYLVGNCCGSTHNNFFVFSLSGSLPTITSAVLSIGNAIDGYGSQNPTETLQIWDVSTPISTLTAPGSGRTAIYNDLGSGTLYGSTTVSAATNGTQVVITLNSAAIAALNAQVGTGGGSFAFGGSLTTTVPEPGSIAMLGLGALALGLLPRRRKRE